MTDTSEVKIKSLSEEELERATFDYQAYVSTYIEGFITKIHSHGIIDEVEAKDLKKYFSNPDEYQKEIENIAEYYYISSGEIFQLFEMAKVLPSLNYKIESFEKPKSYEKHVAMCNKALHKVKHRTLTRDIISQLISTGTICGIWLGSKEKPYFYIFDDLDHFFPAHRLNGEWVVAVDMAYFDQITIIQRDILFNNLKPYVTKREYDNYKKDKENNQYVYLPQDKTAVIRTHTLKRSQNRGMSWVTQGMFDLLHKKKLRDLEKSVANKIINAVAVLKIGSEKNPDYANMKLNPKVKQKIHAGIRKALEKSENGGVTLLAMPEYSDISFPEMKGGDVLEPKKFESINNDITTSLGLSQAILNGTGSNFASAKLNVDAFYKRLSIILEEVEQEVYQKLFNIILPTNQLDNYRMVYDKDSPLSNKDKIDILLKLHTQEGFSLKAIIDSLDGIDFNSYIEQSVYEQEEMKLPQRVKPYASAFTSTGGSDDAGRDKLSDGDLSNENTVRSRENGGNDLPE